MSVVKVFHFNYCHIKDAAKILKKPLDIGRPFMIKNSA